MADGATDSNTTDTSAPTDAGCNGAVNAGFEDTEGLKTNAHNGESRCDDGHPTNGELKSPTKDGLPPAEAVNLELVTMSPYTNSIPVKKESTELDMTDPYDEYFVPVNQHKKYIRGEKLYVTQDKRENLAGSKKKCCCGIVTVLVLGAAIAILVAVLLTQESGGLTESEARNYDKAGFGGNLIPTPPPRSPAPQPPPTTDMSQIYLKNVLEGELTIDNMEFTPGLSNSSSLEFMNVATSLEDEIKKALFDHQRLHYGASEISVKVIEFRPGSVITTYRVGWRFKEGIHDAADPIDMEMLRSQLQKHLKDNDGFLYNYRVPVHSIKSNRVIDGCQIDNNGCSNGCVYNATSLKILCTCPFGFKLEENGRTCVETDYMETHGFDYPMSSAAPPVDASPEPSEEPLPDTPVHPWEGHEHPMDTEPEHSNEPEYDHPIDAFPRHPDEHPLDSSDLPDHPSSENPREPSIEHAIEPTFERPPEHEHPMEPSHENPSSSEHPMEPSHENPVVPSSEHPMEPSHEHPVVPSSEQPMEPSTENPPEPSSPREQPIESSSESSIEPSHEHPSDESHVHLMEEEPEKPSMEPSHEPSEESHEHHLGYLPEPSETPRHDEGSSEQGSTLEANLTDVNSHTDVNAPNMVVVTSPVANENTTSAAPGTENQNSLLPPEYLPEYSTYEDSPQYSQTENLNRSYSTESSLIEPHIDYNKVEDVDKFASEDNKDSFEAVLNHGSTTPSTESHIPLEPSNENSNSSNVQEEDIKNPTPELKEVTPLLGSNEDMMKTYENKSREELVDHLPETTLNKTETETYLRPSVIEPEFNENEKSSNYSDVVNDLHSFDGNPFETERLNELPMINDSMSKSGDHLYTDLNITEKPIEHNVIETFREAKATDFTNSTAGGAASDSSDSSSEEENIEKSSMEIANEDVNESGVNMPITSQGPDVVTSSEKTQSSDGPIPEDFIDPSVYVTPSNIEHANNKSSEENTTELHMQDSEAQMPTETESNLTKDSPDIQNDDVELDRTVKDTESNSEIKSDVPKEMPPTSTQMTTSQDEVGLIKTKEDEVELPSAEEKIEEIEKVMSNGDENDKTPENVTMPSPIPELGNPQTPEQNTDDKLIPVTLSPDLSKPESADSEDQSKMTTLPPPIDSDTSKPVEVEGDKDKIEVHDLSGNMEGENSKAEVDPEPVIFVTKPPDTSDLASENQTDASASKKDEIPMISVTKIPDLMGPFPVDTVIKHNPEVEREQSREPSDSISKDRASVNKLLDDESNNNLNSLEDDYDNDHLKNKYQKQGKSKLLKNFNVKEIYPHHNSSEKNVETPHPVSTEGATEMNNEKHEMEDKNQFIKDSLNQLLSDDGYTTISPLFTSKIESTTSVPATTATTTAKTELTTKEVISDLGLISSEAYTTLSPLFHSKSTEATTLLKMDEITTTAPLIFDLIEGKKVDPNDDEFETPSISTMPSMDPVTEIPEDTLTEMPDKMDSVNETTPSSIDLNATPLTESVTEIPANDNADKAEPTIAVTAVDNESVVTTAVPMTELPTLKPEEDVSQDAKMKTREETVIEPILASSESPLNNSTETVNEETMSKEATNAEITDPVVKLLMNSTYSNSTLYSKCASGQWACLDGSGCIAPNSRCDSDKDCQDGSDEENCQEQGCPGNFQCASGECLKRQLVCDSTPHCADGSDENNCEEWKCNFDEMQCLPSSRQCIPSLWKCDTISHCPRNEDEIGCKDSCSNDEYLCPEGWCIPLSKKCDGRQDCAKGEDELNCPT